MTSFSLKVVGIVSMLIDHIGLFFFPTVPIFRIVGRISFPIFAFLIGNGARHTKNISSYFYRLLGFAFLSQIPYYLANTKIGEHESKLNILFTLALGLLVIIVIQTYKTKFVWFLATLLASIIAFFLNFDYQVIGILAVVSFYLFAKSPMKMILTQPLLFVVPISFYSLYFYPKNVWQIMLENMYFAPFALMALLFIFLYNNKEGPKIKYPFYVIYPLQYVVFYFLL